MYNRKYFLSANLLLLTLAFYFLDAPLVNAVRPSLGCESTSDTGLGEGLSPGDWTDFKRTVPGTQQRTHRLTIPTDYDKNSPSPLFLYFHGWGGNHESCGNKCQSKAADRGFVSVAMTGYGPTNYNSWNHGGSSSSPGPAGATCTPSTPGYCNKYSSSGCDCSDADNCWWTTCFDSVQQTLAILDEVEQNLCVDLDQIWAVGCSNGGMFTFELAADNRSASRLTGIIPIVGLPHYGFSRGPMVEGIRLMGMWGDADTTVPPISNTDNPDKTLDTDDSGWYYTSANKVMSDWTSGNGCDGIGQDALGDTNWGIGSNGNSFSCTTGCNDQVNGVRVVGCIFEGGHVCNKDYIWDPILNFMLDTTGDGECVENMDDIFLWKNRNGSPITRDCSWLQSKNNKKSICKNNVKATDKLSPAQDVCKVTCNSCDPCYENKKTKFFKKLRTNNKPLLKTCGWLRKRKNRDELCEKLTDSFEGFGSPQDACAATCSVDICST